MKRNLPWDLILSKLRQTLSQEEEISFNKWLKLHDNLQIFQEIAILWKNVQEEESNYVPDIESNWKKLSVRIQEDKPEISEADLISDNQQYIPVKRLYRLVAAACIFLGITFFGAYYLGKNRSGEQTVAQTYYSMTGKSKVILPDGSEVWLHSNTTLSYNSDFKGNSREVTLTGEAYFNVKHDSKKPFIVNTNDVSVKVHGTKFNVNSYSSADDIIVSLYEGSVSMKAAGKNVFLKPGEEGYFDMHKKTLEVYNGDVEFAKSWTNDYLRFKDKNLRYVCRYLSKWYAVNIDIDPNIDDNQSYTFTLRNETFEEVIRIMARINAIDYRFDESNKLILKQKN